MSIFMVRMEIEEAMGLELGKNYPLLYEGKEVGNVTTEDIHLYGANPTEEKHAEVHFAVALNTSMLQFNFANGVFSLIEQGDNDSRFRGCRFEILVAK